MSTRTKWLVRLEDGVWLSPWEGDPGRTLARHHAERFPTKKQARQALKDARQYRPFAGAKVVKL